jgi:hypothetical protein
MQLKESGSAHDSKHLKRQGSLSCPILHPNKGLCLAMPANHDVLFLQKDQNGSKMGRSSCEQAERGK